jgi:uncharacterized spore protein YtfJ
MASSVDSLIERVLGELNKIVQTRTVVGEPVTAGPVTLIPLSKISLGFAAGGGAEGAGRSGTGGGATVEPIGFVVAGDDVEGKGDQLGSARRARTGCRVKSEGLCGPSARSRRLWREP